MLRNLINKARILQEVEVITSFEELFWKNKKNEWIKSDRILERALNELFSLIPVARKRELTKDKEITILAASGKLACALSSLDNSHLILIFPDLVEKLKAVSNREGLAIIAHEFGHIVNKHSYRKISNLEAQIEADHFAYECGLGEELQDFLMECPDSLDMKVRISKLTYAILEV